MTARYQFGGWTDPRTVFKSGAFYDWKKYGSAYEYLRGLFMKKKKVNTHEYVTEAKDMPIEACQSLWVITYGDDWLDSTICVEQDDFMWEVGNRLYWAGLLEHDTQTDRYKCK